MTRFVACLALLGSAAVAYAGVEVGGTVGIHVFSEDNSLGMVPPPSATSLSNSALFGLRLGVFINDHIGVEAEGGLIPVMGGTYRDRLCRNEGCLLFVRKEIVHDIRAVSG